MGKRFRVWAPALTIIAAASLLAQAPPGVAAMAGPPGNRAAMWVRDADRLLLYDAVDFHNWLSLPLAEPCRDPAARLEFHRAVMLCSYPVPNTLALRAIQIVRPPAMPNSFAGGIEERLPASNGGMLETTASPDVAFSADGQQLFWFENRITVLTRGETVSRQPSSFLAWTTGLDGRNMRSLASIAFPPCTCTTGACEETCPEIQVWTPEAGVDDFFFASRVVPGQLGAQYLEDVLYRKQAGAWTATKLPAVQVLLDATQHGDLLVGAIADGGCCGWENEGNDQTFISQKGEAKFIFDERERFANLNYDVSFFTPRAKFSPDATRIAYTVASTARPGQEIRLADSGQDNPAELARIKQAIAELPRVEVQALGAPKKIVASAPGELVGWLDDRRLAIVHAGTVSVMDATNGTLRPTPIKAQSADRVWIR